MDCGGVLPCLQHRCFGEARAFLVAISMGFSWDTSSHFRRGPYWNYGSHDVKARPRLFGSVSIFFVIPPNLLVRRQHFILLKWQLGSMWDSQIQMAAFWVSGFWISRKREQQQSVWSKWSNANCRRAAMMKAPWWSHKPELAWRKPIYKWTIQILVNIWL